MLRCWFSLYFVLFVTVWIVSVILCGPKLNWQEMYKLIAPSIVVELQNLVSWKNELILPSFSLGFYLYGVTRKSFVVKVLYGCRVLVRGGRWFQLSMASKERAFLVSLYFLLRVHYHGWTKLLEEQITKVGEQT